MKKLMLTFLLTPLAALAQDNPYMKMFQNMGPDAQNQIRIQNETIRNLKAESDLYGALSNRINNGGSILQPTTPQNQIQLSPSQTETLRKILLDSVRSR